jgi:hypothetical protein
MRGPKLRDKENASWKHVCGIGVISIFFVHAYASLYMSFIFFWLLESTNASNFFVWVVICVRSGTTNVILLNYTVHL